MSGDPTSLGGWLVHVMREADNALSLEESLHALMESMQVYFPCQSVAVILIDEDTKELRMKTSRQISYTFAKKFHRDGPSPTAERVVLEQKPRLIRQADPASAEYRELKLEHDYASAVIAPVVMNRRGVGYIFCDRQPDQPAFDGSDLLHLQVVGYLIGNLIEKFDLIRDSKRLSQVDDATGALQYKAFVPAMATEFERARRHAYPVVLALLSVDAFRRYIETYGIDRAHALLADVAAIARKHIAAVDTLARFGADEFILCLSGDTAEGAAGKLAGIRRSVQERVTTEGDFPTDLTIGALALRDESELSRSLQDILSHLGKSLVDAKAAGKGQVCVQAMGAPPAPAP